MEGSLLRERMERLRVSLREGGRVHGGMGWGKEVVRSRGWEGGRVRGEGGVGDRDMLGREEYMYM